MKEKRLNLRVNVEMFEILREYAENDRRELSQLIRNILEDWIQEKKQKEYKAKKILTSGG